MFLLWILVSIVIVVGILVLGYWINKSDEDEDSKQEIW